MMGKFPARVFHAKARVSVTLILILLLILVSHAARFVAAQPTVQTLPATNITDTSAHLEGQFNTNGQDTEYSFKLFDSSGAEIATCSSDIAPGSTGQFSNYCIAAGRQPSTTYGFAAMARWTGVSGASGDWQFGNVVYFTTLASGQGAFPGPGAETDAATSVTDTSATLNGVVTTNGQDTFWMFSVSDANGGFVQNCPSGNLQFVPPSVGTQSVTCQASQLQPSTTYHFDLQACWQPAGTCGYGIALSFTTSTQMNTIFTNILTALHPVTDWAISNLRITPSSPKVGDQLTFALDLTALNTNGPYPQSVGTNCWVDNAPPLPPVGASPNGGATTYYGPTGTPLTLTVNYPWTATAGTHTITCWVDPTKDPDTSNNKISLTITVGSGPSTPFDFNMALSPSSESVNPGGTTNYMVLLSYSDPSYSGTTINVQLTGLGPGMDYQLSPTGALTITTSPSTPAGTYTFTVVGSALGVTHQTSGALTVTQQSITTTTPTSSAGSGTTSLPFDYSVTVSPSTQSVEIGEARRYVVSVLPLGGIPSSVRLTVMGCPGDVHSSFTYRRLPSLHVHSQPRPVILFSQPCSIHVNCCGHLRAAT